MRISRTRAATLGREMKQILEAGRYRSPSGHTVAIGEMVRRAVAATRSYPPEKPLPALPPFESRTTRFEVENETTLDACRRLIADGHRPVALNFASAKNPGGGFLSGARAQEESLCRSSALSACLVGQPMYAFHEKLGGAMYTNYAIYSPDVPVLRTDDGALLEEPYRCAFITSPAVNAKVVLERDRSRRAEVRHEMEQRVHKVLTIAAAHEHDAAVLGAWGCGVFGNDPQEVAELFRAALAGDFRGAFERVVFAVVDWSDDEYFIGPFRQAFGA